MPRPWRPTPPCARSCGATPARATARCSKRLAEESGIATPTAEDLIRLDRKRKGKRLSNADWASPTDPEARIAKLKDGRTHLAYKPEHAVDLDTGAIVAAEIHPADQGDTTTLPETLEAAEANLAAVDAAPTPEDPAELVADKGYHSRDGLKELEDGAWKSRIAEKKVAGVSRWHGDEEARRAVYNNRARLRSGVAKEAFKLRAELVERSFALDPRSRRHAPGLAARPREPAQALPGPRRRLQSRPDHAAAGRRRHPTGVPGPRVGASAARSRPPMAPRSSSSPSPPTPKPRCSSSASSQRPTADSRLPQRAAKRDEGETLRGGGADRGHAAQDPEPRRIEAGVGTPEQSPVRLMCCQPTGARWASKSSGTTSPLRPRTSSARPRYTVFQPAAGVRKGIAQRTSNITDAAGRAIRTSRVSIEWYVDPFIDGASNVHFGHAPIGYARCSTDKRYLAAQRAALERLGVASERIYTDHGLTGTTRSRPGLDQALAAVRPGERSSSPSSTVWPARLPTPASSPTPWSARGVKLALGSNVYDPADPWAKCSSTSWPPSPNSRPI